MECPACGHDNISGADVCEACNVSLTQEDLPRPSSVAHHSIMSDPISLLEPLSPECLSARDSIGEAISRMRKKRLGCVLVTDSDGILIGVFTERDVLYRVAGQIRDLDGTPVGDVMTAQPTALKRSTPIAHALHVMSIHGFRHIPLVDRRGRPTGLTSFRRVVEFIGANFFSTPTD